MGEICMRCCKNTTVILFICPDPLREKYRLSCPGTEILVKKIPSLPGANRTYGLGQRNCAVLARFLSEHACRERIVGHVLTATGLCPLTVHASYP
jgi:hypothetical protein